LYQRTTVELADLGHSFIVRNGEKLPVNFERLFLEGDLSQNVPIEPNDYVYFASTGAQDIYVLGEVMSPGPLGFVSSATVISAITDRGGFTDRAFKRRVLVVRGSLNEPETFVINAGRTLARFSASAQGYRLREPSSLEQGRGTVGRSGAIIYPGRGDNMVRDQYRPDHQDAAFAGHTGQGVRRGILIFEGTRDRILTSCAQVRCRGDHENSETNQ
jgi:hypothetical protein